MALQTVVTLGRAGIVDLDASAVAADAGLTDWWPNSDGANFLYVNNGSGGSLTVTLQYNGPGATVDGVALANKTVVIATLKRALIGPFVPNLYTAAGTGFTTVAWSTVTSVKLLVVRFTANT